VSVWARTGSRTVGPAGSRWTLGYGDGQGKGESGLYMGTGDEMLGWEEENLRIPETVHNWFIVLQTCRYAILYGVTRTMFVSGIKEGASGRDAPRSG